MTQFLKKMINKVAPNLLGPKSTYTLSQVASFGTWLPSGEATEPRGFSQAAGRSADRQPSSLFPAGREEILSQAITIFQGGAAQARSS